MVSENCILKKLNLSGNCFSDRDVEILTNALEVWFNLIFFCLLKNKINQYLIKEKPIIKRIRSKP